MKLLHASILAISLALTACNSTPAPTVQVTAPRVPSELRHCRSAPDTPKGQYTQRDVATFTLGLAGAYRDCKNKLGQVDDLLKKQESEASGK